MFKLVKKADWLIVLKISRKRRETQRSCDYRSMEC